MHKNEEVNDENFTDMIRAVKYNLNEWNRPYKHSQMTFNTKET